jgi:hypothetical protein
MLGLMVMALCGV